MMCGIWVVTVKVVESKSSYGLKAKSVVERKLGQER